MTAISEREWQSHVTSLARLYGWTWWHCRDSRGSDAGWPDLAMVRDRLLMVELKTATGKVSPDQQRWLDLLAGAGVECHVWRPADLPAVVATLKRRGPA